MEYYTQNTAPIAPMWAAGVPDKPLEWFYPSVFVRGELNGVQGIPGDGKTWLRCELAAQTSVGGIIQGVLDESDVAELPLGKVLYLSGNDAPERLKERLTSRGADLAKIAFAPEGTLPQIGSPEMADLFGQIRPTLCIIDTLQHFIGGASANDMSAITTALQPLQYLARFHNTAVVVVMHISKYAAQGNGGDSTSFSIGSYAIAGIFRTLWTLGRLKEESGKPSATRALCVSKNNYAEFDPPALLFELRDGFRWTGVDFNLIAEDLYNKKKNKGRPAEKKDAVKSAILQLLDGDEPVPSSELKTKVCELTGCHANTIAAAKKELGVESIKSGKIWLSVLPGKNTINKEEHNNSAEPQSL
jgi:RecA-family ATPase